MFESLFKKSWRKRLVRAEPTQIGGEIVEIVADALREDDRVGAIRATSSRSLVATVGANEVQVFLYNLVAQLEGTEPERRVEVLQRFLRAWDSSEEPALRDLVAVLKNEEWLREARAMIAIQSPPDKIETNMPATLPLAADLRIAFAFDRADSLAFASAGTLADLGAAVDEALLRKALATLKERLPPIELQKGSASCMVTCGGNYEASLLLFEEVLDQISRRFQGELLALVPTRDVALFTGSETEGGLEEMRSVAERLHSSGGTYLLSLQPLVRHDRGWVALLEAEGQA